MDWVTLVIGVVVGLIIGIIFSPQLSGLFGTRRQAQPGQPPAQAYSVPVQQSAGGGGFAQNLRNLINPNAPQIPPGYPAYTAPNAYPPLPGEERITVQMTKADYDRLAKEKMVKELEDRLAKLKGSGKDDQTAAKGKKNKYDLLD